MIIDIREAQEADLASLYDVYHNCGKADVGYFENCFSEGVTVLMAFLDGRHVGIGILNWKPRYSLYKRLGIPEIQDLNVIPDARRNGVATFMIEWCEDAARAKGKDMVGIGVGLTRDYGPAQILYAKLGYIPDGFGVTYDRENVTPHETYRMDDDLSLMLVKSL
jgi:GNAT superfamily N-acetyltransferase